MRNAVWRKTEGDGPTGPAIPVFAALIAALGLILAAAIAAASTERRAQGAGAPQQFTAP